MSPITDSLAQFTSTTFEMTRGNESNSSVETDYILQSPTISSMGQEGFVHGEDGSSSKLTMRVLAREGRTGVTILDNSKSYDWLRILESRREAHQGGQSGCNTPSNGMHSALNDNGDGNGTNVVCGPMRKPTPAWALPPSTSGGGVIVGSYNEFLERKDEITTEFGQHALQGSSKPTKTHLLLKSKEGKVAVMSTPEKYVVCIWLPGVSQDNLMIHTSRDSVNVQAHNYDRDVHHFWKILLPEADYTGTQSNFINSCLRIAVLKRDTRVKHQDVVTRELSEKGQMRADSNLDVGLEALVDPIGCNRTEDQLFAP